MIQVWNEVKEEIKKTIGEDSFKNWINKLNFVEVVDGFLRLSTPSNFVKDTVLTRYSSMIVEAFNARGSSINAMLVDVDLSAKSPKNTSEKISIDSETENNNVDEISLLDKRFTFKNFVVGKPNEFAYTAALRVAESDTTPFNPLFLYGGVGLGKTHLMHAIAWEIKRVNKKKKVIYISAEKFMYMFIRSLRFKNTMSFKEMFRNVDVLMIDDVQFIGGKGATQEEFFHTFNDLVENNRQIILSADKSPSDLDGVEDRLKSRLGWGLVADIHPTTYELRLGILQSKVKSCPINVSTKVLEFLAFKITSNIRELEGALNRIIAHASLVGIEINIEVAQEVLKDLLRSNEKFITIEIIQKKVCEYFGVKLSDILSTKRHKNITKTRHVAMYLSKELTTKSLPDIGKSFGGKDHATVIHAVKRVKEMMNEDRVFATDLEILTKALES
ncbi:MAG: chromosomal replication initiator protein DnaA [Holosporales bacterium]|jgi:chromosomal replication initiator protein|nr:chromosomal replication initiator protein DnaA [Holosporales bacterium]